MSARHRFSIDFSFLLAVLASLLLVAGSAHAVTISSGPAPGTGVDSAPPLELPSLPSFLDGEFVQIGEPRAVQGAESGRIEILRPGAPPEFAMVTWPDPDNLPDFAREHLANLKARFAQTQAGSPAPTPEPGTAVLVAAGLGVLAARRRSARA